MLVSGTDGHDHYKPGDICTRDSEWLRRCLVNGLAEALDPDAGKVVNSDHQRERYGSEALADRAGETNPA